MCVQEKSAVSWSFVTSVGSESSCGLPARIAEVRGAMTVAILLSDAFFRPRDTDELLQHPLRTAYPLSDLALASWRTL